MLILIQSSESTADDVSFLSMDNTSVFECSWSYPEYQLTQVRTRLHQMRMVNCGRYVVIACHCMIAALKHRVYSSCGKLKQTAWRRTAMFSSARWARFATRFLMKPYDITSYIACSARLTLERFQVQYMARPSFQLQRDWASNYQHIEHLNVQDSVNLNSNAVYESSRNHNDAVATRM